jgi:hypothetical protein
MGTKPSDAPPARPALPAKWRDWRRRIYTAFGAGAAICTAGAFTESFTGLTVWSLHHDLAGWWLGVPWLALLSPTMVDIVTLGGEAIWFLAVMDGWDWRARWAGVAMAAAGLAVSVAGNTGRDGWHVPVDRLATYAVAPLSMAVMTGGAMLIVKRHFGRGKRRRPRAAQQQPPDLAQAPAPPGETPPGRPRLVPATRAERLAAEAERDARAHWPGRATPPGVREVRATLGCGQARAERVIAAVARLAARQAAAR